MSLFSEDTNQLLPTSADLRDQVASIMKEEGYCRLFAELTHPKSPLHRLLLRHPDDLFPKLDPEDTLIPPEFSVSVPLLLFEVPRTISEGPPTRPTVQQWLGEPTTDSGGEKNGDAADEGNEPKEVFEQGTFEELVLLNGIRILQHNPHLLKLAGGAEPVTLPEVRKALGQEGIDLKPIEDEVLRLMGDVADQEGVGSLFRTLLRRSANDTESAYEMKKMVSEAYQYVRQLLADAPKLIGELHRLVPAIARKGAPFLQAHNSFVAWVYGISPSEYLRALDVLWTLDMLHPMVVTLTCTACVDSVGQPLALVLSSDLSPMDLRARPRCGWCGGPTRLQAFFGLDGWIQKWITTRDGLLAYGVAYLLERSGLSWQSNLHTAQSEHDFHVRIAGRDHLIECKVFQCSAPSKSDPRLEGKVREAISQLIEHMIESQAVSAILICHPNPFPNAALTAWISDELRRNRVASAKGKVSVIGFHGVPEYVQKLQQSVRG